MESMRMDMLRALNNLFDKLNDELGDIERADALVTYEGIESEIDVMRKAGDLRRALHTYNERRIEERGYA